MLDQRQSVCRGGGSVSLADRACVPCTGKVPPLTADAYRPLHEQVSDWDVVDGHHLQRTYRTRDFATALALVNAIGEIAEAEFHHPDIELAWGRAAVKIWTHKIDGLTESDFVFAAKCDRVYAALPADAKPAVPPA